MIFGAILAGGTGTRMQSAALPKQFLPLAGCPILIRTLRVFLNCEALEHIFIAVPADHLDYARRLVENWCPDERVTLTPGGATRTDTLFALIDRISERFGFRPDDRIVTHDAVRPFVTVEMLLDNIAAAQEFGAAGTAVPAVDTILESADGTTIQAIPPRNRMYLMQTPQTFSIRLLRDTYRTLDNAEKARLTDGCGVLVARGIPVRLSPGSPANIKITTPADYALAQAMAARIDGSVPLRKEESECKPSDTAPSIR